MGQTGQDVIHIFKEDIPSLPVLAPRPKWLTIIAWLYIVGSCYDLIHIPFMTAKFNRARHLFRELGELKNLPLKDITATDNSISYISNISIVASLVYGTIGIVVGIGLLKQKRLTGQLLGSVLSCIGIIWAMIIHYEYESHFNISLGEHTFFGIAMNAIFVYLLNITFKENLVH